MATILIIDDEERNRKLLEMLMIADGYEVILAVDGRDGMGKVAAAAPDLILLDVMMPGMDGFEVARALKTNPQTQAIPILVASSLDDTGSRRRMMAVNIDAFLVKPIDRWELSRQVKQLLQDREKNPPATVAE